jgi:hypothetical protein
MRGTQRTPAGPCQEVSLLVGFPLDLHDTLHHLPVVRQAVIASLSIPPSSSAHF